MSRTSAVGAMLAPEGRETGCRESTESSGATGSGSKGGVGLAFNTGIKKALGLEGVRTVS